MQDFEKLGVFYLGRPYDFAHKKPKDGWLLYDSKDLVTHAVCVGMTGSGKTGLCLALLEEAAIDGIPAIIIDPKGDLSNLLLTFPELRGKDFAPWINEDDARKQGLSSDDYATQQAEMWKNGLASWGQDGERIQRLKDAADFAIYTPGSNAGLPVSILKAFSAPAREIVENSELLHDQIHSTVSSLLGLIGVKADPLQSPPHILISAILESAWTKGQDLDLVPLIQQIQTPPFPRLGAFDIESFYPSKQRFELAKRLNNLIAAPSFQTWMQGERLHIDRILHTQQGKPRHAIFSIAHLDDPQRMLFVSLLLNQMVAWTRRQSGTTSLRAIIYMDEIFGYFPPVQNPPSKLPLLTLLKQARAFGVGVVLATQNPVDLDYKGLANAGTWLIGRLQTERDKARVLEGLEGASAGAGHTFDRHRMEQTLAGLGNRMFLMNNVHEDEPVLFETRWCLSYLRGPLTRTQIKTLMEPRKSDGHETIGKGQDTGRTFPSLNTASSSSPLASSLAPGSARPVLPPDIRQYFIPLRSASPRDTMLIYQPMLLGAADIGFIDAKARIDVTQQHTWLIPMTDAPMPVDWDDAVQTDIPLSELEQSPESSAVFSALPPAAGRAKSYETASKDFSNWLYRTQKLDMLKSPSLKQLSKPGEPERDFRVRLQQAGREQRDQETERLRKSYAPKIAALGERIRRAEQAREREAEQAKAAYVQTAISVGATLLGAFLGRKTISTTTIGRATTAARGVGRSIKEAQDAARAGDTIEALQTQLQDLEAQFKTEADGVAAKMDSLTETLETVSMKPNKSNISVKLVALAWVPYWQNESGTLTPAWQ
ncbi:MAG: ATP-binding protein [Nitrospirota bacterium]|nr:ATP-binding protein [Nitrospirota bacterium]